MHSPDRLTLPLMVQSGEGATDPDADASRIVLAFSTGLGAPGNAGVSFPRPLPPADAAAQTFAGLFEQKRVDRVRGDPAETDAASADLDLIAPADFRNAGD